jgi:alkylation response protein AidB-like acyl-CoA dehydrogenase
MDFELSDDQAALTEGVRSFCQGRFDIQTVRHLAAAGGVESGSWGELAEMGVFSLRLPEAAGGVGLGWADAVLTFAELGRALVPGPLVWTHLAADLVPGAATGEVVVTGFERDDPAGVVEFPGAVDVVLVLDDAGVHTVDPSALGLAPQGSPLDPLTPIARITSPIPEGEQVAGPDEAEALRRQGAALTAGFLLGLSEAATDLAVAYAKERVQFDRPIGAFQALKHLMADMFTRTEVARGAVYAAGVTLDDPVVGSVPRAVAAAKVTAGEAALGNTKSSVQVHGGMGYTWEVDAHLHLKRAYALEPQFGSSEFWAEVMADLLDPVA